MREWLVKLIQEATVPMLDRQYLDFKNHQDCLRLEIQRIEVSLRTIAQRTTPAVATIKPAVDEEQERETRKKLMQRRMGLSDAQAADVDWDKVLG